MFTHKDIENKTVFVINCIAHDKSLRVNNGELYLQEKKEDGEQVTLTKFPFQKVLALFVIGHITITTPLLEKCKKYNLALIVTKPNLRPVFYWADAAEANYLLRQRQHAFSVNDLSIARLLVENKISNQLRALRKTRRKDELTLAAIKQCEAAYASIAEVNDYNALLGKEGVVARTFFAAYFQSLNWQGRKPRMKSDAINVTLDIGYTILFNFMECFLRMFGFDLYIGIYHCIWFKRKSLVCDLIEPFRCLIDHTVLLAFHRKQFTTEDFELVKHEYRLKRNKSATYYQVFYKTLISKKGEIFLYVQSYYRCFMGQKSIDHYPKFHL